MRSKRTRLFSVLVFALTVLVAAGLTRTVLGGFNVPDVVSGNFGIMVLVCLVAQGVLFGGRAWPERKWVFRGAYLVLFAIATAFSAAFATTANPTDDVAGNYFVSVMVLCIVNVLCFALSHGHAGTVVLLAASGFLSAYIQFMYVTNMLVTTVFLLMCCLALVFARGHLEMQAKTPSRDKSLSGKAVTAMVLVPLVATLAASAVVIGIIMPLNPPHAVIKLETIYLAYEEEHVISAVTLSKDAKNTTTSKNVDESLNPRTTTNKKIDRDSDINDGAGTSEKPASNDYLSGAYSDIDLSSLAENARAMALNPPVPWPLIIAIIIAALVLILTLPRYIVHRVRLRRIKKKEPADQVRALCTFFLGRFKKLGIRKPDSLSIVEYANSFRYRLEPYVGAQAPDSFDYLTALYVSCTYGGGKPDSLDLAAMYRLYDKFYPNVRKYQGTFRYLFRYFFL